MSSDSAYTTDELIANAVHLGNAGKFSLDAHKLTDPVCTKRLIMLLSTTSGALQHLNGVLVDEATLYQKTDEGVPLADVLEEGGVLTGIQVNMGSVELPDGLAELFQKCKEAGAKFIQLHVKVDPSEQSPLVIDGYANSLARVATISQDNGLVPIVAPEILVNGCDDIDKYFGVIEPVLATFYKALNDHHVLLEGTVLTPTMVTSGFASLGVAPQVIAEHTLRALKRTVPAAVPAVIFPHGELGEEEPTLILEAIIRHNTMKPWRISSFGIVDVNMLMYFAGEEENMEIFQAAFTQWCKAKAKAPVVMPEVFETIEMSEGFDTVVMPRGAIFGMPGGANFGMLGGGSVVPGASVGMPGGVGNFWMPGGVGSVPGATFVMPERFGTIVMPVGGTNFGMPGGGGPVPGVTFVMPEGFGTTVMPGGGANFGMPGGGGPVPGASQNLRAAEYNYEFKFGFNVHSSFSATAR